MPHNEQTLEVFQTSFTFDKGFLHPATSPVSASSSTKRPPARSSTRRRTCP